jgi:putative FmdB family regulatory protein
LSASDACEEGPVPTYEYACTTCEERLEAVQKFSDDPLTVCPECGGRLRKLFSPVGIVFKGSGFYRTDSRSSGVNGTKEKDKKLNGSSSDSPPASEKSAGSDQKTSSNGSGSSSGEAKPAKKTGTAGSSKSSAAGTKVA